MSLYAYKDEDFYKSLTTEQQSKLDKIMDEWRAEALNAPEFERSGLDGPSSIWYQELSRKYAKKICVFCETEGIERISTNER